MEGTTDTNATSDPSGSVLDDDGIPDTNQSLTCFSCQTELQGLYCHECGNKNDDYRRSIGSLVTDLLSNITATDSRVARTLWSLFRNPGSVSREYADGARTRWTSPVRLYLASSLALFGYLAVTSTQLVAAKSTVDGAFSDGIALIPGMSFFVPGHAIKDLDSEFGNFQRFIGDALTDDDRNGIGDRIDDLIDTLTRDRDVSEPEENAPNIAETDSRIQNLETLGRAAQLEAMASYKQWERLHRSEDTGIDALAHTWGTNMGRAGMSIMVESPQTVTDRVNRLLKIALFFMLPFSMLVGAMFVSGAKRAMMYDHLVHAAYIHAVAFILLLALIIIHHTLRIPGLALVFFIAMAVYLPLSTQRMFGRSRAASMVVAYGVGFIYVTIILALTAAFAISAFTDEAQSLADERLAGQRLFETSVEKGAP